MTTLESVMVKIEDVPVVVATDTIRLAIQRMLDKRMNICVIKNNEFMVGTYSMKDALQALHFGKDLDEEISRSIVPYSVISKVAPDVEIKDGIRLMAPRRLSVLIVEDQGKVMGVVTMERIVGAAL
jgi:CBS domain containing-hemolysin-like protein